MNVHRGDVVFVDYSHSDRTGSKVRPCVVVQCDRNNARLDDTVVVMISTRTAHARTEPTQLFVDIASPGGQQSGLLHNSAVLCENILTIDRSFVRRRIGSFPPDVMRQINDCLKASLDIC